jgi:ketosteroid isomerase-like protein
MATDSSSLVEKSFTPDELTALLVRASQHLVERCRTVYCDPAPPADFCFVSAPVASSGLLTAADVVRQLLQGDGSFRDWINLSPVAVAGDRTVLEVDYPDRFTTQLIVGTLAFPFEPFHLLGPAIPPDGVPGTPPPKVTLPPFEPLWSLLEAFTAAWNRHDIDAIMSMMTDDCVFEASAGDHVNGERHEGQRAVRAAFEAVFAQYPDARWNDARCFVKGNRGVSEWTFTGTRSDGARVEVNGCDLLTLRDGKIVVKNSFRKNRPPIARR